MSYLSLFNLIVYNLLQINLRNVLIFHCWQLPDLMPLAELFSRNYIFSQYVNLNQKSEFLANFHRDYLESEPTKLGVFLDLSCSQSSFITNQTSRARLYTENFHWLLYDEAGNMRLLEELFDKANLSINADVTYVKPNSREERNETRLFTLYDVYNKGSHLGGKLNITIDQSIYCNQSDCEIKEYLSDLYKRTRLQQRSNLQGITFRQVALVTVLPLNSSEKSLINFLNSEDNVHLDWISRLGYRNNLHLQEMLKFNVSYVWRDQWSLNDTIGGAMGEVVNEHVELSTTAFVISDARLRKIFPTTEIGQFRSVCIFRTPHNAGIKAGVFLEPFKPSVWLVFAALLVFSGLLLWIIFGLEQRWLPRCLAYIPSLLTSCLISIGAACIQGSNLIPNSTGGRLAFISLMLTSFLMYNYYTSIVVSTLLGSPVRSNIKTVQQLADSSLDVGFHDLPFNRVYLNSSPRSDIISLVKRKVEGRDPKTIWLSAKEGVLRVRQQPGFVFGLEASFSFNFVEQYYLPHEICELNEILFRPESRVYTIVHRNSTYRELLKQIQLRMLEGGMTQKHRRFYTKSKLHCFSNNYVINVGMEYAAPLFIALLVAYFVALFILLLELSWAYMGRRYWQRLKNLN
ncbi:ionotropic receptor 75a [Drosophila innubila]|uniref:ionotropic receptor 75a n=1 Tax=Drosophila innubila TaxID=198719 RepID=UPI00148BC643|nr:ionotropic receptor 75a [Drosophila innubila]